MKGGIMLTAEIKINGRRVAMIEATNVRAVSDKPGDFIGNRATVYEYDCTVKQHNPRKWQYDEKKFTVIHDRRFGWQGLLNKITETAMPTVVETISVREE